MRVWDIVGEDQVLKGEYKVISGKMCGLRYFFCAITPFSNNARSISSNDLEWDGESKRIIAVGDGKEKWVAICVALRGPK